MTNNEFHSDLVILVADKNMEHAFRGVLSRGPSLGLRDIAATLYEHPEHDPGCRRKCHDFLRPFSKQYAHAIVAFDLEGCGREQLSRDALQLEIAEQLSKNGWGDRAAAIVIEPELDVWVWSDSPHVAAILGWKDREPALRIWLEQERLLTPGHIKPTKPKEAMEKALRLVRKPRSSALYELLAKKVSLERCVDPAFLTLKALLQEWFGNEGATAAGQ